MPSTMMKEPLSREDYFAARFIADPYGLYDCSLLSDGAGVLGAEHFPVADYIKSIWLLAERIRRGVCIKEH